MADHQEAALFTFQTSFAEVSDVQWWPGNPTTFALASSRGCIEVRAWPQLVNEQALP
jgi:hypothetical protein